MSGSMLPGLADYSDPAPLPQTEEERQAFILRNQQQAQIDLNNTSQLANGILPGLMSVVVPAQTGEQAGGIGQYIPAGPGIAGLYGMADTAQTLARKYVGGNPDPSHLPGGEAANAYADAARKQADNVAQILPAPQTDEEKLFYAGGNALGSMGVPGIGLDTGITNLPKLLQPVGRALFPAAGSIPFAAGNAGLSMGIDKVVQEITAPKMPVDPTNPATLPTPPLNPNAPDPAAPPTVAAPKAPEPTFMPVVDDYGRQMPQVAPVAPPPPGSLENPHPAYPDAAVVPMQPTLLDSVSSGAWTLLKDAAWGTAAGIIMWKGSAQFRGALNDMRTVASDALFNAAQDSLRQGNLNVNVPVPRLPGEANGPLTEVRTKMIDRTDRIMKVIDATADTPSQASQLRAQTGAANNNATQNSIMTNFLQTGTDQVTGRKMPVPVDHWERVAAFTPDQTKLFNDARYAADELDNRLATLNAAKGNPGVGPSTPGSPVNAPKVDDFDLRALVAAGNADPQVARELKVINTIHRRLMEIAVDRGFITASDAVRIKQNRPNYLASVDASGQVGAPFEARDITPWSGTQQQVIHSSEVDKQHLVDMMAKMTKNDSDRAILLQYESYQNQNPGVARVVERRLNLTNPVGGKGLLNDVAAANSGFDIAVRVDGLPRSYTIHHPAFYRDMTFSEGRTDAITNWLSIPKQLVQAGTTGPLTLATGAPFAAVNSMRTSLLAGAMRPEGSNFGPLSSAISNLTGGKINLRGIIPDAFAGTLGGILAHGKDRMLLPFSSIFDRSATNIFNTTARKYLGDAQIDTMVSRLEHAHDTSIMTEMKEKGLLGAGGYGSSELPTYQLNTNHVSLPNPANDLVPQLFRISDPTLMGLRIPVGKFLPTYVHVSNLVKEVHDIINTGTEYHYYDMNRNNPRISSAELPMQTRNMSGDVGIQGQSELMRKANKVIPWFNISIQGLDRMGHYFANNPVASLYGYMSTVGTIAAASIYTAMLGGPAHVAHLQSEMSDDEKSKNATIYSPGSSPDQATILNLPQELRPGYAMARAAMFTLFNLEAHEEHPDIKSMVMDGLHDFFKQHLRSTDSEAIKAGFLSLAPPVVPSFVQMGMNAIAGKTVSSDLGPLINGDAARNILPNSGAPNILAGSDPLTATTMGAVFKSLMSTALGATGTRIYDMANSVTHATQNGKDMGDTMAQVKQTMGKSLRDSNKMFNGLLWQDTQQLSAQPSVIQQVQNTLQNMRVTASDKSDEVNDGLTRPKGLLMPTATPETLGNKVPDDPTVAMMYTMTSKYMTMINQKFIPLVTDQSRLIKNLETLAIPRSEKTDLRNEYQRKMNDTYAQISDVIGQLNHELSEAIGKPVSVGNINWQGGMKQFQHQEE